MDDRTKIKIPIVKNFKDVVGTTTIEKLCEYVKNPKLKDVEKTKLNGFVPAVILDKTRHTDNIKEYTGLYGFDIDAKDKSGVCEIEKFVDEFKDDFLMVKRSASGNGIHLVAEGTIAKNVDEYKYVWNKIAEHISVGLKDVEIDDKYVVDALPDPVRLYFLNFDEKPWYNVARTKFDWFDFSQVVNNHTISQVVNNNNKVVDLVKVRNINNSVMKKIKAADKQKILEWAKTKTFSYDTNLGGMFRNLEYQHRKTIFEIFRKCNYHTGNHNKGMDLKNSKDFYEYIDTTFKTPLEQTLYVMFDDCQFVMKAPKVKIDEYGDIDIKSMTKDELVHFRTYIKKVEPSKILNLISCRYDENITYKPLEYIFYPLFVNAHMGIIFGKAGDGKSMMALEIANFIAKGECDWDGFRVDTPPQKVLFLDFENGAASAQSRYKKGKFHKNLIIESIRSSIWNTVVGDGKTEKARLDLSLGIIEAFIDELKPKVVFIDNLSYITNKTEQAGETKDFLNSVDALRKWKNVSVIWIGHQPKITDGKKAELNDLKGSSTIAAELGSCVAFRRYDKNLSYMKQVKHRDCDLVLDESSVATFEYIKDDDKVGTLLKYVKCCDESELIDKRKNNGGRPVKFDIEKKLNILYDHLELKKNQIECSLIYKISKTKFFEIKNEYKYNVGDLKDEYELYVSGGKLW